MANESVIRSRFLNGLIEKKCNLETEEQRVFRTGRSCIDNIFYLKQIIEKKMAMNQMIRTAFVEEAYITVPTVKNWEVLQGSNINYMTEK
jgi:hypothetical protein